MTVYAKELLPLIPLLPLLGAITNGLIGYRFPRGLVSLLACGSIFGSFVLAVLLFWGLATTGPEAVTATVYTWMSSGGLSVELSFVFDHLSAVMTLVVTGVGFLIHVYSIGYMAHDPSYARYFAYLNLFAFAMLVLVLGDSLPVLFIGWEGVGLCSYLLIGFWYTDTEKASAGKKAFIVNRIGDFGFIVAMLLLVRFGGDLSFEGLQIAALDGKFTPLVVTGACLMLVLGATGKSAQIPLYIWLPDAMAGPTPVSALIHAATMVTAGVYMTARMGFLFVLSPTAMITVAFLGVATALFAATIGTAQNDIKKVLAYSTVSQLGFMFIAAGVGAYAVAVFHLVTHAFFKACLFLGSGSVIHGMSGEQDIRKMGGLWKKMPYTCVTFIVATLAITGFPIPFLSGFVSKDAILWNAFASAHGTHFKVFESTGWIIYALGVVAAGFTAFYMWRLVFLTFFSGELRASKEVASHVHESPFSMTSVLVALAVLSVVGGAIGWPHIVGGGDWITSWLQGVTGKAPGPAHPSVALEWGLMAISFSVAGLGCVVAFILYFKAPHPVAAKFATQWPTRGLYQRVLNKWDVDELYDVTVVRPLNWLADAVLYKNLERRVIDGLVNATAWVARSTGFLWQPFQGGNIQSYLAVFVMALAVLLYGWLAPLSSSSSARVSEEVVQHSPPAVHLTHEPAGR